jgi:3-hydroxybutyryl-CoA dehydrogenase
MNRASERKGQVLKKTACVEKETSTALYFKERSIMKIKKVGVVGCGIMGSGIAQVCAQSGYHVIVSKTNGELLAKGLSSINSFLSKGIERGKLTQEDKQVTLGRIKGTTNIMDFYDCDLVIEAATEKMHVKKNIFADLDRICPKYTILATNTSAQSVIDMAYVTSKPDKVLGLHFFNPAPIMKLLEIVKTIATNDETVEIARNFGKSLGKSVIVAPDTPGFIVNRLLTPFLINAIRIVEAGVATIEDVDAGVTLGLNHPMGPFRLLDFGGLDSFLEAAGAKYEEFKDPQYAPPVLLKKNGCSWLVWV